MQDYRTINDFRKGYRSRGLAEDPTYLSFFFMFDYYTEHSPLFNGEARSYLNDVVKDPERVEALDNFIKILSKVNSEYPWFWQSVTGLEETKKYDMMEPFRGEDKAIEIGCLETVELTIAGMMDLYKRAAFDFNRWVEVIPRNLRRFNLHIWVSEVRTFSGSSARRAQDIFNASGVSNTELDIIANDNSVKSVRPYFKITLGHCEFDPDSTNTIFSDLSRNPESPITSTINIKWQTVESEGEYANSSANIGDRTIGEMIADIAKERAGQVVSGAIDRTVENLRARLLLGNVHGVNALSTIQDAISAGSINGIANLINTQSTRPRPSGDLGQAFDPVAPRFVESPNVNIYGQTPPDSEGPLNDNVYGPIPQDSEGPLNDNVYGPTPQDSEGPLNENVYDQVPQDSEGPINQNVYGPIPQDSEGPINQNAHDRIPTDSEGPINQNVYGQTPPDSEGPINQNVYDRIPTDSEGPINQNVHN